MTSGPKNAAWIGVSDHGGWAILVTVGRHGYEILDRRRVELIDDALPALPHHHEGQLLSPDAAVALVERVRASAEKHAAIALDALATAVPHVAGVALRARQPLPPTIQERMKDHRARNVADWVMYRKALARASEERGWQVHWFDPKTVYQRASEILGTDFEAHFVRLREVMGPPWNSDHKLAMAAAIVALTE